MTKDYESKIATSTHDFEDQIANLTHDLDIECGNHDTTKSSLSLEQRNHDETKTKLSHQITELNERISNSEQARDQLKKVDLADAN